ncbi:hypothetical protein HGB07_08585 [Candidatus Roizmanbacteria bacterium]|nr:hypothetical protein [Candidatus Roizmanbacteria bacterium]
MKAIIIVFNLIVLFILAVFLLQIHQVFVLETKKLIPQKAQQLVFYGDMNGTAAAVGTDEVKKVKNGRFFTCNNKKCEYLK